MSSAGAHHPAGAEVDVFVAACWRAGDPKVAVSREQIYRDWLVKRIEASGARVGQSEMTQFKLERMVRRTQGDPRKSHTMDRPAATFRGTLEIADSVAFDRLLRRGVGRHRAFGFGMLLLRRAV
jgi:CRISPR system Cascade subunit CasE